jgi:HTH-type transcriptional regulator/antitoxin HigA
MIGIHIFPEVPDAKTANADANILITTGNKMMTKHPGILIRKELEKRGWSQRDLAWIIGCSYQGLNLIVKGKRSVTPEMSIKLGEALTTGNAVYYSYQQLYDLQKARIAFSETKLNAIRQRMGVIRPNAAR